MTGTERRDPTVAIRRELYDRLKAALQLINAAVPGRDLRMTDLIYEAVVEKLARIEQMYNNGQAITGETKPLRRGRTIE
ncbi:hypothetical protein [Nocardia tengchongensis]|uniref:hypothetical protein n=1 Tax=Nocardia tengchongensis TaxID=2055889 RepID=UPI00360F52ED